MDRPAAGAVTGCSVFPTLYPASLRPTVYPDAITTTKM
jgi:hypothetical protein